MAPDAVPGDAAGRVREPGGHEGRAAAGGTPETAQEREAAGEPLEAGRGREDVREPETGDTAREALARAQEALMAALVAGQEAPRGFDRERLRIQETGLISKRRRTVARLRPDLAALLGDGFAGEFDAYARGRPKPPGGSHADARDFADRLRAAGRLPEEPVAPEPGSAPRRWSLFGRRR
ncbi:hypothetical protein AB0G15_08770 [Streptosporangium sp. NPDC023825]|uniref:hypothetical protein n=1 Tax=Streptosporangium sp. NPDC023825 TaxID=3154909 RepID=UPI00343714C2